MSIVATEREHKLYLGKCDYNGSGRQNCKAFITWALKDGPKGPCFSMQAEIWNPRESDIYCGGQCVDKVAAYFPTSAKVRRMVEVWTTHHLNDLTAGSPAQEAWLKANPIHPGMYVYPKTHYDKACELLAAAGLNPDISYSLGVNANGREVFGYKYGSAWLYTPIPEDVLAEIRSW